MDGSHKTLVVVLTIWLQTKLACYKTIALIRLIYHGGKLNLLLLVRVWLIKIQSAVSSGRLVIIHTGFTHFQPDRKHSRVICQT